VTALNYNATMNVGTFTFTPNVLADANYRATLLASGITDASGNPLDGDGNGTGGDNYTCDFFQLTGDANHDRYVDIVDLGVVGSNWQQSPRGWAQGDFDYSGLVDIVDLGIVGSNWQAHLAAPAASADSVNRSPIPSGAGHKSAGQGRISK
jgi:hypothetical protein